MRSFSALLIDLEREVLADAFSELVARHPELQAEAEALCEAARAVYARTRALPPIELAQVQASLRGGFQAGRPRYSVGLNGMQLAAAIRPWLELAGEHLDAGAGEAVLDLLAVILDELAEAGDAVYDPSGELYACVLAIDDSFARALLLARQPDGERRAWERRIEAWSANLEGFLEPEVLRAARVAVQGSVKPG